MDVKTLCLGVLSLGEASGYEIKKFFEDGFSHFYVAGFGSIYPALAQLTREGHVTCSNIEQEKRPAKKVYQITDTGLSAFREALAATYPSHKVRSDFMVQLVFSDLLATERLEEVLEQRQADIEANLQHIDSCLESRETTRGGRFAAGYARAVLQASYDYIESHKEALLHDMDEGDN
jgi:DNA-binding PadR family transcriptional regulator